MKNICNKTKRNMTNRIEDEDFFLIKIKGDKTIND